MDEFEKWLDGYMEHEQDRQIFFSLKLVMDKYRSLRAKQTAPQGLVEYPCPTCGAERFKTERRIGGDSWCRFGHKHPTKDFVRYQPAKVEEPLAVLADRKGYHCVQSFVLSDGTWTFHLDGYKIMFHEVYGDTYAEAEAKARAYLEGLPDVTKEANDNGK